MTYIIVPEEVVKTKVNCLHKLNYGSIPGKTAVEVTASIRLS